MDRFEDKIQSAFFRNIYIYIPVWIDLKLGRRKGISVRWVIYIPVWIDLKEYLRYYFDFNAYIYIPVWIDLKNCVISAHSGYIGIYIPVWIDLKKYFWWYRLMMKKYLHSSMDRFEDYRVFLYQCLMCYLHSSMDRFEALFWRRFAILFKIYIPVWIDLKTYLCRLLRTQ